MQESIPLRPEGLLERLARALQLIEQPGDGARTPLAPLLAECRQLLEQLRICGPAAGSLPLPPRLPLILFELSPAGETLYASDTLLGVTGFHPRELRGDNWWQVFCPQELSRDASRLRTELESGDVAGRELCILARDRSQVVLELYTANLYGPEGKLERVVAAALEVTARRRTQEALAQLKFSLAWKGEPTRGKSAEPTARRRPGSQEEERGRRLEEFGAAISVLPEAVLVYGPEGEILLMNRAAEDLFPYGPEERKKRYSERIQPLRKETPDGQSFPLGEMLIAPALQGETVKGLLISLQAPDRHLWVSASASAIHDPTGELIGILAVFTDITGLQRLQRQQQLYTQTISHDLRIPLTVIQGHAELLQDALATTGNPEPGPHVEAILQATERMNRMIEDLVDAVRLEGGQMELLLEEIDLACYLEDCLKDAAVALEARRIRFESVAELPPVLADPDRLERIMLNLLSNALKYSPKDSPVDISLTPAGQEVIIAVQDRGEGISAEDLPHIFERFYRSSHSPRRPDSVGLGLFITRMLVQVHGGRIWVESRPGEGSTFFFTLPAR